MASFLPGVAAALSLALAATPAAAEWREASTDHFLIYADAGDNWLRGFAERLERASGALRALSPQRDPAGDRSNRIVIYAVSGIDGIQKLCGRCGSVAGFYVPRICAAGEVDLIDSGRGARPRAGFGLDQLGPAGRVRR